MPVIVDPSRTCPLEHYRGATLIKPNRVEAELATGRKIVKPADALAAGAQLCRDLEAQHGPDHARSRRHDAGRSATAAGEIFPTHARAVYDITGAGDMVMAMIGLCLAGGAGPADAVRLANVAAGLEVERSGVAVIYRDEIRAELLSDRDSPAQKDRHARACRRAGRRVSAARRKGRVHQRLLRPAARRARRLPVRSGRGWATC